MFQIALLPQVNRPIRLLCIGIVSSLLLLLMACGSDNEADCLKSTGSITTERRELPAFRQLYIYDNLEVVLVQDTAIYAEVRTGENLQEEIKLEVTNHQLIMRNTSTCNWTRRYDVPREIRLHTPSVLDVFQRDQSTLRIPTPFQADQFFYHFLGSGDADLNLHVQYLNMDMYELGDVTLRGTVASDAVTLLGGSGTLRTTDLTVRNLTLQTTRGSIGDAHVRATNTLGITHAGAGTVFYRAPTPYVEVTGRGNVVAE
ncbi:DUF2807 domain-containing protein [Hymenobacter aerilatus]|uniref:DUF2807 domain-containing protein n=1 Tax=Hymenobacter aerilatus TaxID=2932251 RepID=A0A8T9SZB3_9BACT|nr:DUF2807 domain-containing protein [Hymenobacter aerilatus]UOR07582.1 DUF2807 domain-containing protein [Hymenobacter aerilatus]